MDQTSEDARQNKDEMVSTSAAVPVPEAIMSRDTPSAFPLENWSQVPKRKPVPTTSATGVASAEAPPSNANHYGGTKETKYSSPWPKWTLPSVGLGWRRSWRNRTRKLIILGIVLAILLLALILGLAIGLTVGKKKHSNLPLPTAHGGPYEGDLTYYAPGLGACGFTNSASEMICAISHVLFDAASTGPNPNDNPLCGLKIRLQRQGTSVDVKIVDRCVGCAVTDIDVAPAVFEKLANLAQGRVPVHWSWLEQPPVHVS